MPTCGPLGVNLFGTGIEPVAPATHPFDDRARVAYEDGGIVQLVVLLLEDRGRGAHGIGEPVDIDANPVASAELLVTHALKGRPGINQREIHVEEHGLHGRALHRTPPR